MAQLKALSSTAQAFRPVIDVSATGLVLGRGTQGPGTILAPSSWQQVSNRHFVICSCEGRWAIRDLSRNGTFINGEKLSKDVERELHGGEKIKISVPLNNTNDTTLVEWEFVKGAASPATHSPVQAQVEQHAVNGGAAAASVATASGPKAPVAPRSVGKRKPESSPPLIKRPRSSDGASWALEQNVKLRQQLQTQHEAHLKELGAVQQRAKEERTQLLAQLAEKDDKIATAGQQAAESAALEEARRLVLKKDEELQILQTSVSEHKSAEEQLAAQLQTAKTENESLQAKCEHLEGKNSELANQLGEERRQGTEKTAALSAELQTAKGRNLETSASLKQAVGDVARLRDEVAVKQGALQSLQSDLAAARAEIGNLQAQLEEANLERGAAQGRALYLSNNLDARQYALRDMEEVLCSLHQARARAQALEQEEKQARSQRLQLEAVLTEDLRSLTEKLAFATDENGATTEIGATALHEAGLASQDETDAGETGDEGEGQDRKTEGSGDEEMPRHRAAPAANGWSVDADKTTTTQLPELGVTTQLVSRDKAEEQDLGVERSCKEGSDSQAAEENDEEMADLPQAAVGEDREVRQQDSREVRQQDSRAVIPDSEGSDQNPPERNENCPPEVNQPKRPGVQASPKSLLSPGGRRLRSQGQSQSQTKT